MQQSVTIYRCDLCNEEVQATIPAVPLNWYRVDIWKKITMDPTSYKRGEKHSLLLCPKCGDKLKRELRV